ncbi:hypothetical protein RJ640_021844 [Escallonia rubra]|uniref:Uncharacterized protein n=1 Tax=Escallonia rubra TaxID=112253 RepID=A0AA88SC22_9ASTE|nr:hypothetical protein RJ640_021844 [Escallonia rubra]
MAGDEIAKLVETLLGDKSPTDLALRLRSDPSLKLGLEKFYLILENGLKLTGDGQLGLQSWDQSQIQAVGSVSLAIVHATRSLSVEHAERLILAVVQKSVEFALCCLEKSMHGRDDLSLQNYMVQVLELALVHEVDREYDFAQPCSLNMLVDSLSVFSEHVSDSIELQDHTQCMLQVA